MTEIYRIQKEKQDLFNKFGYRIRGGALHKENPLNRTFTAGYPSDEPEFGDKRLPRDAPACLVRYNNGGGNMASLFSKNQKKQKKKMLQINITQARNTAPAPFYPNKNSDITTAG